MSGVAPSGRTPVTRASIPQRVVDHAAAVEAYLKADDDPVRVIIAAALEALGCEWDDDQGHNTLRRIVGTWVEP